MHIKSLVTVAVANVTTIIVTRHLYYCYKTDYLQIIFSALKCFRMRIIAKIASFAEL